MYTTIQLVANATMIMSVIQVNVNMECQPCHFMRALVFYLMEQVAHKILSVGLYIAFHSLIHAAHFALRPILLATIQTDASAPLLKNA
jgi:hypothetical protein